MGSSPLRDAKKWIAPCGLNCYTCSGNKHGVIAKHAQTVQKYLKGFAGFAPFLAGFNPIYKEYAAFDAILNDLANAQCEGCRSGHPLNQECGIYKCTELHKGGTCAECGQFPCNPTGVDETLRQSWVAGISDIKARGLARHWTATKGKSHFDKQS